MADDSKLMLVILKDGRSFPVSSIETEDESGYVVNLNPNKRPVYKELTTLKYQDIMYSNYYLFERDQEGWRNSDGAQVLSCFAENFQGYEIPFQNNEPNFLQTEVGAWSL